MEGGFAGDTEQNSTGFTRRENVSTVDPNWLILRNSGVIRISVNAVLGHDADFSLTVAFIIIGTNRNLLSPLLSVGIAKSRHSLCICYFFLLSTHSLCMQSTKKLSSRIFELIILKHNAAACKLIKYFEHLLPDVSSWIIVCLTVERCLCTSLPHKIAHINRPKIGYIVVASITVILILLNLHLSQLMR